MSAADVRDGAASRAPALRAVEGDAGDADQAQTLLVQRAIGGDAGSVGCLVRQVLPAVKSAIRGRIAAVRGSVGDVSRTCEDLTQELFLELFAHEGRVLRRWSPQLGLPLERFVALIADRRAVSYLRTRRVTELAEDIDGLRDELPQQSADPAVWLQSAQALNLLFAALTARLSPLGQRVFRLLFVDEHEVEEVSRMLGMSGDAVYAWRSRLKRRAAMTLRALDYDSSGAQSP